MELFLNDIYMILKPVFSPPGLILLLFFIGLLLHHYLLGKLIAWLTLIGFYLLMLPASSQWLAKPLETIPPVKPEQLVAQQAEVVLILGAGRSAYSNTYEDNPRLTGSAIQRLVYAAKLHRATGLPLMFSGGIVGRDKQSSAELAAAWLRKNRQIEIRLLEGRSETTWQNAAFSKLLLDEHGFKKVAVVTHAAHMPRAIRALQAHGIDAVAAPFGYLTRDAPSSWWDWRPGGVALSANMGLLHEHIGTIWYAIKEQFQP